MSFYNDDLESFIEIVWCWFFTYLKVHVALKISSKFVGFKLRIMLKVYGYFLCFSINLLIQIII